MNEPPPPETLTVWSRVGPSLDLYVRSRLPFSQFGMPAGRVREPIDAADDPVLRERGVLAELHHPDAPADRPSGFLGPALPIAFAGRVDLRPAENLGASTEAVLRELGGCGDDDLARLRADGVVA